MVVLQCGKNSLKTQIKITYGSTVLHFGLSNAFHKRFYSVVPKTPELDGVRWGGLSSIGT